MGHADAGEVTITMRVMVLLRRPFGSTYSSRRAMGLKRTVSKKRRTMAWTRGWRTQFPTLLFDAFPFTSALDAVSRRPRAHAGRPPCRAVWRMAYPQGRLGGKGRVKMGAKDGRVVRNAFRPRRRRTALRAPWVGGACDVVTLVPLVR